MVAIAWPVISEGDGGTHAVLSRRAKRRHAEAEGLEEAVAMSGYESAAHGGYFSEGYGAHFAAGARAPLPAAPGPSLQRQSRVPNVHGSSSPCTLALRRRLPTA
jgi:hypothetical protein